MGRVAGQQGGTVADFEIGKIETRRDGAGDQRESASALDAVAEPPPSRQRGLRKTGAAVAPRAKTQHSGFAAGTDQVQPQRGAGVKKPELVRSQAVQCGNLASFEQEVDGRGGGARTAVARGQGAGGPDVGGPVGFGIPTALGVRFQFQFANPIGGGVRHAPCFTHYDRTGQVAIIMEYRGASG